ncbi:MAG: tetratricopeptide repeat protein [Rheinheimera sp.]|nr:tetratricopeptide repeat protein [Rheinheimera sp.]
MWRIVPILLVAALTGCQQTPADQTLRSADDLLQNQAFMPVETPIETREQIFKLPEDLVLKARQEILAFGEPRERSLALLKFIFRDQTDPLQYVNNATLTALETYEQREANCLSLTILSYSLARSLGFRVQFQDVQIPEYWITRNGTSVLNGHVNLVVTPPYMQTLAKTFISADHNFLIDFERAGGSRERLPVRKIREADIVALFYNNKAADAMLTQQFDLAYRYLQEAAAVAPAVAATWNNLAVLYRQRSMPEAAELAYLQSLALEPEHPNTMANLAILYDLLGRHADAARLSDKVQQTRQRNPYYFVMQGNEALSQQRFSDAETAFHRSIRLEPKMPEALFGLARVAILQHDYAAAFGYLQRARLHATPGADRRLYDHKIEMLNAVAQAD